MARRAPRVVVVPADVALAFTPERGWHLLDGPPGWLEEAVRRSDELDGPQRAPAVVDELAARRTACRPGSGPCRRHHAHASTRRALAG
jgi:hypothetical protein